MATRNLWPRKFAEALIDLNAGAPDYSDALKYVRGWLFDSLEPAQLEVYDYVDGLGDCDSSEITVTFGYKQNHAATILKSLFDLGLLKRERVTDASGSRFVYEVAR